LEEFGKLANRSRTNEVRNWQKYNLFDAADNQAVGNAGTTFVTALGSRRLGHG